MTRSEALRDLAERLAEANGAIRVVSTVLGMAAIAAAEMSDAESADTAAPPKRPASVAARFSAHADAGAHVVMCGGAAVAFAETPEWAERVAAALNLAAAIDEQEPTDAA